MALTEAELECARERFMRFVEFDPFGGCWLWTGADRGPGRPYGNFHLAGRMVKAHHASLVLFCGAELKARDYQEVGSHACHVSLCVNPTHLAWSTHQANVHLQIARGTHRRSTPKVCADDAAEARILHAGGITLARLADRYRVHPSTVAKVVHRRRPYD